MASVDNRIVKPITVCLASPVKHRPTEIMRVHVFVIAAVIRTLMMLGYVVVLVGRCRSGKTLILERATPDKIICKLYEKMNTGAAPTLNTAEIPSGLFSIDDTAQFESDSLLRTIADLSTRPFVITFQSQDDLLNCGLDEALGKRRRAILILN